MNAASIPQAKSTLRRSLFSPTEGDLLTAFGDSAHQIVSPLFVRTKDVGSLFAGTAPRIALEISRRATNTGQRGLRLPMEESSEYQSSDNEWRSCA